MAKGPGEKGSLWFPCSCELGVGDRYKQEQRIPEGGHRSLLQGLSPLVLRNPNPKMASLNLMPHSARTTYCTWQRGSAEQASHCPVLMALRRSV